MKLDPTNSELNNNYGYFLCHTGRERESIEYFNQAIRDPLYRTPARANQNAGACLMRIKDYAGRALLAALVRARCRDGRAEVSASAAVSRDESGRQSHFLLQRSSQVDRVVGREHMAGLRVARANADLRTETQLANELKQRFPQSPEAAALARGDFNE